MNFQPCNTAGKFKFYAACPNSRSHSRAMKLWDPACNLLLCAMSWAALWSLWGAGAAFCGQQAPSSKDRAQCVPLTAMPAALPELPGCPSSHRSCSYNSLPIAQGHLHVGSLFLFPGGKQRTPCLRCLWSCFLCCWALDDAAEGLWCKDNCHQNKSVPASESFNGTLLSAVGRAWQFCARSLWLIWAQLLSTFWSISL